MSKPLIDEIERWIQENPQSGYSCLSDFLHEAARLRFEIVKLHGPLPIDQNTTPKAVTTNYDKLLKSDDSS